MPKKPARDKHLLSIVGIVAVTVVLAACFAAAWIYLQREDRLSREISYLRIPSVSISRDGHSIAASFAFRTSAADGEWAARNKAALEQLMKKALLEADPVASRAPNALLGLQEQLRDTSNAALQTTRIQEVLITDFLVSEGDY